MLPNRFETFPPLSREMTPTDTSALLEPDDKHGLSIQKASSTPGEEKKTLLRKVICVIAFLLLMFSRGLMSLFTEQAEQSIPTVTLNGLRSTGGAIILFVICFAIRIYNPALPQGKLELNFEAAWRIGVLAVIQSQLPVLMIGWGVGPDWINSGVSSVVLAITPVATQLLELIIDAMPSRNGVVKVKKLTPVQQLVVVISLIVAFLGTMLVCLPDLLKMHSDNFIWGFLLVLGAAVDWAIAAEFNARHKKKMGDALPKTFYQSLFGGIGCLLIGLVWEYEWPPEGYEPHFRWFDHLSPDAVQSLIAMIVVVSVLAILSNNYLLDEIGSVNTTSVWLLVPIVGMVAGIEFQSPSLWPPGFPVNYKIMQVCGCLVAILSLGVMLLVKSGKICAPRKDVRFSSVVDDEAKQHPSKKQHYNSGDLKQGELEDNLDEEEDDESRPFLFGYHMARGAMY